MIVGRDSARGGARGGGEGRIATDRGESGRGGGASKVCCRIRSRLRKSTRKEKGTSSSTRAGCPGRTTGPGGTTIPSTAPGHSNVLGLWPRRTGRRRRRGVSALCGGTHRGCQCPWLWKQCSQEVESPRAPGWRARRATRCHRATRCVTEDGVDCCCSWLTISLCP